MFHIFNDESGTKFKNIVGLTSELKVIYIVEKWNRKNSIVFVTHSLYEANQFYQQFLNYTEDVLLFPMDDFLTSEALAISPELKYKRLETLNTLIQNPYKIIVTNLMGYLRFLPKKEEIEKKQIVLHVGDNYCLKNLEKNLLNLGYSREVIVNKTGEYASRGFVLDIFLVNQDDPVRIEFWDDIIESIKIFNVDSQRSTKGINTIEIFPNSEFIIKKNICLDDPNQKDLYKYGDVVNICNYGFDTKIIYNNYYDIVTGYDLLLKEILDYNISQNINQDEKYMHDFFQLSKSEYLNISDFDKEIDLKNSISYCCKEIEPFYGSIDTINQRLNEYLYSNKQIYICVNNRYSVNRILENLKNDNIIFTKIDEYIPNKINLIIHPMNNGFIIKNFIVITEKEIFNKKEKQTIYRTKFKFGTKIRDISKLNIGDYIVHSMHGIGRYIGMKQLLKNGLKKDYLVVEYLGGDKLYIPAEKIEYIHKYSSNDGRIPKLNRLGTTEWQKTKLRVKKKIEDIAEDLLRLYSVREKSKGFSFSKDTKEQIEFEKQFPYELTEDQFKVIEEVKEDMESEKPMDRLLCGDVGFGKTEVAFRAMFKAVMSGKQVALLCPTTILSNQHYQNAKDRFDQFGIEVALLNRFITGAKLSQVLERLKEGKIDIIIGTHKVLGKNVIFKDLGLLIIDEEQRFGVTHKEKIKKYKNNIDVLTLSATPIPRTLQMSMAGLRSLSLIETPPTDRYPVQTYVLKQNNQIIKDAIYKELSRNGQIFLLYNYVDSIELKVREIQKLVPEAKIVYAHGRMTKTKLENIMLNFVNHNYDILICTTIIETGIDIPNVNTLLILDADKFGLSQLYQIRGRVGRTNKIAYCYLMYDPTKILSEVAIKRLKVIKEFTELGSGFSIAMRDLSIRGAGDLLGSEQAGFIDSVGVDIFMSMLNEEINKLNGKEIKNEIREIPLLDVESTISNDYVEDDELKIEIHQKINQIDSERTLKETKKELEDRFGMVSKNMEIYMYEQWFEKIANHFGIKNIKQTKNFIEMVIPKSITEKIDGKKLFLDVSNCSRMFRFGMRMNQLIITLDIVNLDKHFIYYLLDLMNCIESCIKK